MTGATPRRRDFLKLGGVLAGGAVIGGPLVSACASSGSGGGGSSGSTVGVLLLAPLTGTESAWGPAQANSYNVAAKWLNDLGGIKSMGGAKLSITVKDTETTPSTAASEAQQAALNQGISVITGCNQSGASIVVSQIAKSAKIPFVTGTDTDPRIGPSGGGWSFQLTPPSSIYASSIMDFATAQFKAHNVTNPKVAILSSNSDLGQECTTAAQAYAKQIGLDLAYVDYYDSTKVSDFTPYISKYSAAGVQALIGTQDPQPAILIVRAMQQLKWQPQFMGGLDGQFGNTTWESALGKTSDYTYSSQPWSFQVSNLGMETFVPEFTKKAGRPPNDFDQSAFSAVAVIADALERAGSSDRQKLRTALAQTNLDPGSGIVPCMNFDGIKFNSSGKNVRANNLVLMSKGGENYTVSPAKYADSKPLFPRPPWASI